MKELKVLIVDDEILAIEYLREIIPWHENGYIIVGEATSAGQAYELFMKHRPQIVISDICMPGTGGLEFCGKILSVDPSVKILLLTAYKEFEYAKKAIELGVVNYLLKHEINAEMLLQVLKKLRMELAKEDSTHSIVKKHTIMNYIDGNIGELRVQNNDWTYLESEEGLFVLLVLKEDIPYPIFENTCDSFLIDLSQEMEQSYENLSEPFTYVEHFKLRNRYWAVLFSCCGSISQGQLRSGFYAVASKTQELFQKLSGKSFSAVASYNRQKIRNITAMYNDALKILNHTVYDGTGKIVFAADFSFRSIDMDYRENLNKGLQKLDGIMNGMNTEEIVKSIDKLFGEWIIPSRNLELLRYGCDELLRLLNKWCRDHFLEPVRQNNSNIANMINNCYTAQDINAFFQNIFILRQREIHDGCYEDYSQKVKKAIRYLYENYRKDISVMDVANDLEVSDSHLSRIFRSETGKTLLEYLTFIRIEMAKNLLDQYNYKIYEISEMVGYKTSQYFSQVFVKMTGMNPLDYREREKKHDKK